MNINDINYIIDDYIKIMARNNNIDSIVLSGSKTSLINDKSYRWHGQEKS